MGYLLTTSDFSGKFMRPNDQYSTGVTLSYITNSEKPNIRRIFGATLGNAINTYIDNNRSPVDPILDKLIDPFSEDAGCNIIEYPGLKVVLLGLIWFEINIHANKHAAQNGGQALSKMEMSRQVSTNPANYIDSVVAIREIQHYCRKNREDYPAFNGQYFETTGLL